MKRYERQMLLPNFGREAQEKLLNAKILIVGLGGLGCPAVMSLASAGVGTIGMVDFDVVQLSNLHRQTLYSPENIEQSKVDVAFQKLSHQFNEITFISYNEILNTKNIIRIMNNYDLIVDCTDNFSTRYLVNDACVLLKKTFIYGAIFQYEGQVAVFNYPTSNGRSCHYRNVFPNPPEQGEVPSCNEAGVLGTLTSIIGNIQANEVIKIVCGLGQVLSNKIFVYNSMTNTTYEMVVQSTDGESGVVPTTIDELENMSYDFYCENSVREIDGATFLEFLKSKKKNYQIIDVRNNGEQPSVLQYGAMQIPLAVFEELECQIEPVENLILVCQSGVRSKQAGGLLKNKNRFQNVFSVRGGIKNILDTNPHSLDD